MGFRRLVRTACRRRCAVSCTTCPHTCTLYASHSHLHVHMLSVNYISHPGAIVGQAQLLDDVVGLLELGVDFKERTLGYALTDGHKLMGELQKAGLGSQ